MTQNLQVPKKRIYALLIGIDKYPEVDFLRGAVADVDAMEDFLKVDLGVPSERIVALRNGDATRSRIFVEFQALWQNRDIQYGDPILIYFAGHGGLTEANEGWKKRYGAHHIQVIFPFDYKQIDPSLEGANSLINAIPDKSIATLLNALAAKKGNNITVIFDSCHSASGSRAVAESSGEQYRSTESLSFERRYRGAEVTLDIPHDIDDEIFAFYDIGLDFDASLHEKRPRDAQLLLYTDQASHIHLAACGVNQKALEEHGRGIFTTELLKIIRRIGVGNVTYHNLLRLLDTMSGQSPQCYGANKDRYLFDDRVSPVTFIPVRLEYSIPILKAGEASGVTVGSTWELHKAPNVDSESVGLYEVTHIYVANAVLRPPLALGNSVHQLYARFVRAGKGSELVPNVWISPRWEHLFEGPKLEGRKREDGIGYAITSIPDIADIKLEVHPQDSREPKLGATQGEVTFYLCDNLAQQYGVERLPRRTPARKDVVEAVLFSAARWLWQLRRMNSHSESTGQMVSMNMMKIADYSHPNLPINRLPEPIPVRATLPALSSRSEHQGALPGGSSIGVEGIVDFAVDSALYGFKLQCKLEVRLPVYVRVFYFDTTDLSIKDMFGHNIANSSNTPDITPGGEMMTGDGGDGGSPTRFSVFPGRKSELGYMKVFWSTQALELDDIKQDSPFGLRPGDVKARGADLFPDIEADKWGTVCLALVMRAPA